MSHFGVLCVLDNITNPDVIANFIKSMDASAVSQLFTYLEYVKEETRDRWLDTYSMLMYGGTHGTVFN